VLALSSVPALLGTTKDDNKNKPALLKFYDFTKGGTDIVDQRIGTYTTNSKSNRWTWTAFSYIVDTARVNAQTLHSHVNNINPRKTNSFDFALQLAKQLIRPLIERRDITHLNVNIRAKIFQAIGQQPQPAPVTPTVPGKRRRCHLCMEQEPVAKKRKLNAITTYCSKCSSACCKTHSDLFCHSCSTNL
jgi:hypothetical protein